MNLWRFGRFVRGVDAGKVWNFSLPGLFVQAFRVTSLCNQEWRIDKYFDELPIIE